MNLRQRILRFFQPDTERERVSYRAAVMCASAHAEELNRCVHRLVTSQPIPILTEVAEKEKRHA